MANSPLKLCSLLLLMLALSVGGVSCSIPKSGASKGSPYTSAAQVRAAVEQGPAQLASVSRQMDEILQGFRSLNKTSGPGWKKRGYLIAAESDQMETLLFQYLSARDVLCDMTAHLGGRQSARLFTSEDVREAAHVLTVDAQFVLVRHSADLVTLFAGDKVAIAKLNEAQYESQIPAGSYDLLRSNVTAPDVERRLEAGWTLFQHNLQELELEEDGAGNPIIRREGYPQLIQRAPEDYRRAHGAVLAAQGRGVRAEVKNTLTHTEAAKIARELGAEGGDLAYSGRSLLFKVVSRMKNPEAKVIAFSRQQHAEVEAKLQPGDVILTYTAGYMSDVFIPGAFKHGITYVGTPEQRRAAGVDAATLPALASPEKAAVEKRIAQATLADGQKADVIEAVAEGVIFNNLGHIMDTHVNRLAVLRPRLSEADRAAFITEVFAYQGDAYDFLFDFADASRQVCTEVIYRGLDGRQGIRFGLTKRGGHPTLSADDVVNYHFKTGGRHFEFVLYAEEDLSKGGHRAKVLVGAEGEGRLREVMGAVKR